MNRRQSITGFLWVVIISVGICRQDVLLWRRQDGCMNLNAYLKLDTVSLFQHEAASRSSSSTRGRSLMALTLEFLSHDSGDMM